MGAEFVHVRGHCVAPLELYCFERCHGHTNQLGIRVQESRSGLDVARVDRKSEVLAYLDGLLVAVAQQIHGGGRGLRGLRFRRSSDGAGPGQWYQQDPRECRQGNLRMCPPH